MNIVNTNVRSNISVKPPEKMKQLTQWLVWGDEKKPKNPRNPDEVIDPTDPSQLVSFKSAYSAAKKHGLGIGFSLTETDPYMVLDLDDCRDRIAGKLKSYAEEIIENTDTYAEISPSGTGIHVIAETELESRNADMGIIEIYSHQHYVTYTGNQIDGTPKKINHDSELDKEIEALIDKHKSSNNRWYSQNRFSSNNSDQEVLDKALDAANGENFRRLYYSTGDCGYKSKSEADLALFNMLAYWTECDKNQMIRLFMKSDRGDRDKVQRRRDYVERTAQEAINAYRTY